MNLICFLSSTNKFEDEKVAKFAMSFVYMRKSRGPKILLCGFPESTGGKFDEKSINTDKVHHPV